MDLLANLFQALDELLSFARSTTADETQQNMHVIMINNQIQVNAYFVYALYIDIFKTFLQL